MSCKDRLTQMLAAIFLSMFFVGFSLKSIDEIFAPLWKPDSFSCFPSDSSAISLPGSTINLMLQNLISSEPLAYLFQIVFILFIISPPLIVLMLFLIWKELKKRNKLK